MTTKTKTVQALVVRDLWERARQDARSDVDASWMAAALLAGLALETALRAAYPQDKNGPDLVRLIPEFSKDSRARVSVEQTDAAHRLRKLRNDVQHDGKVPSRGDLRRHLDDVEPFLAEVVRVAFDANLNDIRLVDLLDDPLLAPALREAYQCIDTGDHQSALAVAVACYEQMRFRISEEMVAVRAPLTLETVRNLLLGHGAMLSRHVLVEQLGLDQRLLVMREADLADGANRLLSIASLGMSAVMLAGLEKAREALSARHKKQVNEQAERTLAEFDTATVEYIVGYVTRHAWRLEETQPELFGALAFQPTADAAMVAPQGGNGGTGPDNVEDVGQVDS